MIAKAHGKRIQKAYYQAQYRQISIQTHFQPNITYSYLVRIKQVPLVLLTSEQPVWDLETVNLLHWNLNSISFNERTLFFLAQIFLWFLLIDQKYKLSISEWYKNLASTSGVVAHEIGHAIGLQHDFGSGGLSDTRYDSQGNACTGINGVMDYGSLGSVDKFSTCSKEDFAAFYSRVTQIYGSFCLSCCKLLM